MAKVLVIEDDDLMRDTLLEILLEKGYEAIGASNGQAGVQEAIRHRPDLVLCDVVMPVRDGYWVLTSLASNPATAAIAFVFLTGRADQADWRRGMQLGADDYLIKPCSSEELLTTVATRLRRRSVFRFSSAESSPVCEPQQVPLRHFAANTCIPLEPESLWQVRRGLVKLSAVTGSGDEVLVGWAVPPMIFGPALASSRTYFQAMASGEVELVRLTRQAVESTPHLARELWPRLNQSEELLAISGQRQTEDRLRDLLVMLARETGEPCSGGTRIGIRLTHQELANAIGVARVTVTLLLGRFRQNHWIGIAGDGNLIVREVLYPGQPLSKGRQSL